MDLADEVDGGAGIGFGAGEEARLRGGGGREGLLRIHVEAACWVRLELGALGLSCSGWWRWDGNIWMNRCGL